MNVEEEDNYDSPRKIKSNDTKIEEEYKSNGPGKTNINNVEEEQDSI